MFLFHDKYELSLISIAHYQKLILRSLMFLLGLAIYLYGLITGQQQDVLSSPVTFIVLMFLAMFFVCEMVSRLIPSPIESMGCEKQFARNLERTDVPEPMLQSWKATALVVVSWLLLNDVIGAVYLSGTFPFLDAGFMYLLCLAYSVCDMICILFFCPFQTWMMHNKCCGTCRIYNWDYAMMFTPLLFVPSVPAYIVFGMALAVLVVWEYRLRKHPERFSEATNVNLSCANCPEKLCRHKKQLQGYLAENREALQARGEYLSERLRGEIGEKQKAAAMAFNIARSNMETKFKVGTAKRNEPDGDSEGGEDESPGTSDQC